MRPEDVPEELVKLAWEVHCSTPAAANLSPESMRHALAAVLPLAVAEERAECAKVVQGNADACTGTLRNVLDANASAIRSRGEPR